MKTAELTGALLDYWVAKAEGQVPDKFAPPVADGMFLRYSSDWADGGPLIEKYNLELENNGPNEWACAIWVNSRTNRYGYGDTPLQAICRAVVRAKFGDEVPE